jgi:hypothetical protein
MNNFTYSLIWNMIILILIFTSLWLWYISYEIHSNVYVDNTKITPLPLPLDLQFSKENFPTIVYNPLFTAPNPWIGGFNLPGDKDQRSQKIPVIN